MPDAMQSQGNDGPVRVKSELTEAQKAINRQVNEASAKMEAQLLAAEMKPVGQPADVISRRNQAFQGFMDQMIGQLIPGKHQHPKDVQPGQPNAQVQMPDGTFVNIPTGDEYTAMKNELESARSLLSQTIVDWAPQFTDRDEGAAFWGDKHGGAIPLFERKLRDTLIVMRGGQVDTNEQTPMPVVAGQQRTPEPDDERNLQEELTDQGVTVVPVPMQTLQDAIEGTEDVSPLPMPEQPNTAQILGKVAEDNHDE